MLFENASLPNEKISSDDLMERTKMQQLSQFEQKS